MTERHVILQLEAQRNIAAIYDWLAQHSVAGADRWYRALGRAVQSLRSNPERCSVARESAHFDVEIRDLHFKTQRGRIYRILFTIRDAEVHVLYLRGPGQDLVRPE